MNSDPGMARPVSDEMAGGTPHGTTNEPSGPPADSGWVPDRLGEGFYCRTLPLGEDPDGEGEVCATLVRYAPGRKQDPSARSDKPAVLWVHGMTDYFFADHVARYLTEAGFDFYAVDLRKCGRSHRPGQRWHYATDMSLYYPDLNAALDEIAALGHDRIAPLAHSTGGLIVALWIDWLRRTDRARHRLIPTAIFNSPWLDMMKVPRPVLRAATPLFDVVGRYFPALPIPGGGLSAFGQSIHRDYYGEWDFDTTLKPIAGAEKYVGWVRAILTAQEQIWNRDVDLGMPCLTLCSLRSELGTGYRPTVDTADAVIDTHQTQQHAPHLSDAADVYILLGARHDVFLSRPAVRAEALAVTAQWLHSHVDGGGSQSPATADAAVIDGE